MSDRDSEEEETVKLRDKRGGMFRKSNQTNSPKGVKLGRSPGSVKSTSS